MDTPAHRPEPAVSAVTDVRVFLSRLVLAAVAGLAFWPVLLAVLGMNVTTIRSGSMEPTIMTGDVVAASGVDFDDVQPGQIVTVRDPLHEGGYLTHRVHAVDDQGRLVTQGDANATPDSTHVEHGDAWLGRLRVPWVGYPVVWAEHGDWWALGATVLGVVALVRGAMVRPVLASRHEPDDDRDDDRGDGDGGASSSGPRAELPVGEAGASPRRSRLRAPVSVAVVAGALAVAVVGLETAGTSAAAFAAQSTTAVSRWSTAAVASLGAYGDAVMASGPFFWFRMDETTCGAVLDSSGHGNNSFHVGTADCSVAGALPSQVSPNLGTGFQGTSAIASNRTYPSTAEMSFEMFVNFKDWNEAGGASTVAEFVGESGWRDRLWIENSNVIYQASPTSNREYLQGNVGGDGAWHYVAVSLSNGTVNIRVDGFTWTGSVSRATDSTARFVLGTHAPAFGDVHALGTDTFKGRMDEVALYHRALTPAEMLAHYEASFPR